MNMEAIKWIKFTLTALIASAAIFALCGEYETESILEFIVVKLAAMAVLAVTYLIGKAMYDNDELPKAIKDLENFEENK